MAKHHTSIGQTAPVGTSKTKGGTNFSLYSQQAEAVSLLFFDNKNDQEPAHIFELIPSIHNTFNYWHICISNVPDGQLYGYKIKGNKSCGKYSNEEKLLVDPYTKSVVFPSEYHRDYSSKPGNNNQFALKSQFIDLDTYDWEDDTFPETPYHKSVIYEMHVSGFTKHPSSNIDNSLKGTYKGLIEKIPYLKSLGITAVELLPVHQFDPTEGPMQSNYWGYSTIAFFAPHNSYATNQDNGAAINEFRDMVKAFHKAGIEVILDVVFNHTSEAGLEGPTQSFKGICNKTYYMWDDKNENYLDYTGCFNTVNGNNSVVRRLIMDCLHFWVQEMHVDGFRFDLASVLSRDTDGTPLPNPPIIQEIETDPILAGTKIIAEAWDASGLHQVGNFAGNKWSEWNGYFRDDVRKFIKGDDNSLDNFTKRFLGSPDIYFDHDYYNSPTKSINFVSCHDGFTLNDVVSYNEKHNMANGETNRDGVNENYSWNCGFEGETTDPEIEELRLRQIKNLYVVNLLAFGVPMIYMGDEIRRTQNGNNNAYCHDKDFNWFDWNLVDKNNDLFTFVADLIDLRKKYYQDLPSYTQIGYDKNVEWHGVNLNEPDFNPNSRSISFTIDTRGDNNRFHLIINMFWDSLEFQLPPTDKKWMKLIDTGNEYPYDCYHNKSIEYLDTNTYHVGNRSIILLKEED